MARTDTTGSTRTILLYGDVDLNIIDGSAVWLVSMAEALSLTGSEVCVLLKTAVTNTRLLERIAGLPGVEIVQPDATEDVEALKPRTAAQRMAQLDAERPFDVVIARGAQVAAHVANSKVLGPKSWLYITDIAHPRSRLSEGDLAMLRRTVGQCRRFFVQTEAARSHVEATIPEAAGKTLVLTPMVPDEYFDLRGSYPSSGTQLSAVYSGKFARKWRTLEMCSLPAAAEENDLPLALTMIGDKFQHDPQDPSWSVTMEDAMALPYIDWTGGMSRDEAAKEVSRHDVGLSWRDASMDASLEISTKVLEYAALGVPPMVNRNAQHLELFGADYPLYVDDDSTDSVVNTLLDARETLAELKEDVSSRVRQYSISSSASRLKAYFERSEGDYVRSPRSKHKTRVLIAGHDLQFAGELVSVLEMRDDIELAFDHWKTLHHHDAKESERLRDWADVIICEWCGPNAVWYSNNKRQRQKLIVRLHMFELNGPWLTNVAAENIDALICVSQLFVERTLESTGWTSTPFRVIPNAIDLADLRRPKAADHRFRLGLVGIVPMRKRLDRALDLLEELLEEDSRYTLHIRGRMPWEYPYEWKKPLQREAYLEILDRIGQSPALRDAVVFEPFGPDMASWMRKIGYILSPSSDESFHLAPAEAMASGSIPLFWQRPGVDQIFSKRWTRETTSQVREFVSALNSSPEAHEEESLAAAEYVRRFDMRTTGEQWLEEIFRS
ncbi:glycosyltransferase [Pseudarthrobacter albicanus]|uniref:glycosyltransferase n=1 Tax=Pseudarthrobacter albicanus TaxID=2823873 RepID=UPI001BA8F1B1|nr:glycosyl transferase [Pseudarthrobacter albicanus]